MRTNRTNTKIILGLLATAACGGIAHAQSADSLIDKLVDKGILTVKEGNDLRAEADNEFTKAYQVKTGLPDWVNSMRFGGDLRGRYEMFYSDFDATPFFRDRQRFRYRLRFGMTATLKDDFEVGFRLASGEPSAPFTTGDPISTNTTLQDNGSKKNIFIDLAYAKWSKGIGDWSVAAAIGKIENPFVFSDMVFDGDYTPEGAMQQLGYAFNDKHKMTATAGELVLDEAGGDSNEAYFLGAQLRFDSTWTPKVATSFGIGALTILNEELLTTAAVPNVNRGNTRTAAGALVNDYNPVIADASFTYNLDKAPLYKGPFPIKLAADLIHNSAADDDNRGWQAGITFGKSGKKGTWDLAYRYKRLEHDANYEEFVDSDFGAVYGAVAPVGGATGYGAGTNVKGHIFKATWSPYDSLTFGVTYFLTDLIDKTPVGADSGTTRIQVDAVWKF